jgi:hypothetical protein
LGWSWAANFDRGILWEAVWALLSHLWKPSGRRFGVLWGSFGILKGYFWTINPTQAGYRLCACFSISLSVIYDGNLKRQSSIMIWFFLIRLHVVNSWMWSIQELDFHHFGALKSSQINALEFLGTIWVGLGGARARIPSFPWGWRPPCMGAAQGDPKSCAPFPGVVSGWVRGVAGNH